KERGPLLRHMRLYPDGVGAHGFALTGDGDGEPVHTGDIDGADLGVVLRENGLGLPEESAVAVDGENGWGFGARRAVVIGNVAVKLGVLFAEVVAETGGGAGLVRRMHENAVGRWFALNLDAAEAFGQRLFAGLFSGNKRPVHHFNRVQVAK